MRVGPAYQNNHIMDSHSSRGQEILLQGKSMQFQIPYFKAETECYQFNIYTAQSNAIKYNKQILLWSFSCLVFVKILSENRFTFIASFQAVGKTVSPQGPLVTAPELLIRSHDLPQQIKFTQLTRNQKFKFRFFEHIDLYWYIHVLLHVTLKAEIKSAY